MYIQKGMNDNYDSFTAHYLELPLLLSFKLSAFRLNAGPYFAYYLGDKKYFYNFYYDYGLSYGVGFDIGMFYIGAFYDYGLYDVGTVGGLYLYNRTLGLNVGVNL